MSRGRWLAPLTLIAALVLLGGCVSAGQLAEAHATIDTMTSTLAVLDEELDGLKADLLAINADDPDSEDYADKLIALINDKSATARKVSDALQAASNTVNQSDSAWGWAEAAAGALAMFVPGAGAGITLVRRSRRAFEGVVASIAAGGGPVNPEAARAAMSHYKGLKARVTASRVAIGDKVMDAVKPPTSA